MNTKKIQDTNFAKHLSDKYAPVNTLALLEPFFNKGWTIKSHIRPNAGRVGKEHITLIHNDYTYVNGDQLTVEVKNSNDGSSALVIMGGYGRIVCANGLVFGDAEHGRFIHRGTSIYERLENQYEKIVAHLDKIKAQVEFLQNTTPTEQQLESILIYIRWKLLCRNTEKFSSWIKGDREGIDYNKAILKTYRSEDNAPDAFTLLNVVQENIVRRGRLCGVICERNNETGAEIIRFVQKKKTEGKFSALQQNQIITETFLEKLVA
jgi:hypothetical protein